jgi:predicted amino acid-binding ACT domain protein
VFGDLGALATTEARIVLGAAVADDVMGLVVLTVVVRLVTEGSVSVVTIGGTLGAAMAFLVIGGLVGLRLAPPLFAAVERVSRSTGTMIAIALAFTLAFAELANAARLAPIVGAFVAGIAVAKSAQADRIRRELAPVGHLFIPVFFLQIGIDADIGAFTRGAVLRDAALLLVVAVVGKLVSPIGAAGTASDKPLIGLGMLPRGEVGLIFATIGLQNGVLNDDLYAALLLVVLVTTLATPQLLKLRYARLGDVARPEATPAGTLPPEGGWVEVADGEVGLRAQPPDEDALAVALEAAILIGRYPLRDDLLDWLGGLPRAPLGWTDDEREQFLDCIERGNARSWRFLETAGVLDRSLPELATALRARRTDALDLDPLAAYRFSGIDELRRLDGDDPLAIDCRAVEWIDDLLLALLLIDVAETVDDPVRIARIVAVRLGVAPARAATVADVVADRDLLWSAARQPGGLGEEAVLQLASHLETPDRARQVYCTSALRADGRERWERERLRELHDLVQVALSDVTLTGPAARTLVDQRREAIAATAIPGRFDTAAAARLERAPRSYLLRQPPEAVARHLALLDPRPGRNDVRVAVDGEHTGWWVDVVAHDRAGLLAMVTGALAGAGLEVDDAVVATWSDGAALESFRVRRGLRPEPGAIEAAIRRALADGLSADPLPEAEVTFDSAASPWHTVCEVRAADRPGLLHSIATALAAAGVDVQSAIVHADDGLVIDRFEVTGAGGRKLGESEQAAVRKHLREGVAGKRRRLGGRVLSRR